MTARSPTGAGRSPSTTRARPRARNVLIEDGILVGYMQDRQNARLMGVEPTGNGRRESYAHTPMPRMTNTYMLGGDADPAEHRGRSEGRHLCRRLRRRAGRHHQRQVRVLLHRGLPREERQGRRAGQGRDADRRRRRRRCSRSARIGNDMALDPGIGNCGKAGPMGAGRRRPADADDRRADGGRRGGLSRRSAQFLRTSATFYPRLTGIGASPSYPLGGAAMTQTLFSSLTTPLTPPTTEEDRLSWLRLFRSRRVGADDFSPTSGEHGSADGGAGGAARRRRRSRGARLRDLPRQRALAERRCGRAARPARGCSASASPTIPARLRDIADAPPLLWAIGDHRAGQPAADRHGRRAQRLVAGRRAWRGSWRAALAPTGIVIVSGLARGIDAGAHDAALRHAARSRCWRGGVDVIYPAENAGWRDESPRAGCCCREQPMGLAPQARHFPARATGSSPASRGARRGRGGGALRQPDHRAQCARPGARGAGGAGPSVRRARRGLQHADPRRRDAGARCRRRDRGLGPADAPRPRRRPPDAECRTRNLSPPNRAACPPANRRRRRRAMRIAGGDTDLALSWTRDPVAARPAPLAEDQLIRDLGRRPAQSRRRLSTWNSTAA